MAFWANATTDLTAQGAVEAVPNEETSDMGQEAQEDVPFFLNERPWTYLCRWTVYSRVTTSWSAERVLPVLVA